MIVLTFTTDQFDLPPHTLLPYVERGGPWEPVSRVVLIAVAPLLLPLPRAAPSRVERLKGQV